jgi:hypothetical protein
MSKLAKASPLLTQRRRTLCSAVRWDQWVRLSRSRAGRPPVGWRAIHCEPMASNIKSEGTIALRHAMLPKIEPAGV